MNRRTFALLATASVGALATGCTRSKFQSYRGPAVTAVVVQKSARKMYLMHHTKVLRSYDFELGFAPVGHKRMRGDGRTPEGTYIIDRRNPNSDFHLSLGISYPNEADIAEAKALGVDPGGDIFIHGQPNALKARRRQKGEDWTYGCIAVTNREIEEIYAMVRNGTVITIYP